MNFTWEDLGATKKKLAVEVPAETVGAEMDQALSLVRRQAKLKGFRPGKAPKAMIKRLYGAQIEQEVTQKLMNEALPQALEEAEVEVASTPVLEESNYVEGEPYRFVVSFEVKSQFTVSGYEGLELRREPVKVTEEMVEKRLEELRQAYATTRSVEEDRPLEAGDVAVLDYQAFVGSEPLEGGANPNYQLEVGSGAFHPDFEAELEGLRREEAKEITVTFDPEHYNPKLAGREVRFRVKLLDLKEKVLPDLDDDFARDLGQELDSLADLRARVREDLSAAEEQRVEKDLRAQLQDKLLDLVEFEVSESMVGREIEGMISQTRFNLKRSGLSLEAVGLSEAKLREDYRPAAEKQVRTGLVLERIARDKGLVVSEDEVEARLGQRARDMGQPLEAVREFYRQNNLIESLRESMLREKTLNFLLDGATIVDAAGPLAEEGTLKEPGLGEREA